MKVNSFSPVLLYITWLKLNKVEIRGHCNPQDGLGLKHVSVLWVLVSPLEAIFMQANHRKPVKLKHMGKMIFLEAVVCYWLCLASNYALAFKSANTSLIPRLYIICVSLLLCNYSRFTVEDIVVQKS